MKIKSFIKKHYKKVVSFLLVCFSIFAFTFSSYAATIIVYVGSFSDNHCFSYVPNHQMAFGTLSPYLNFNNNTQFEFVLSNAVSDSEYPVLSQNTGYYLISFDFYIESSAEYELQFISATSYGYGSTFDEYDSSVFSYSVNRAVFPAPDISVVRPYYTVNLLIPLSFNIYSIDGYFYALHPDSNTSLKRIMFKNCTVQYFQSKNDIPQFDRPNTDITDDYNSKEEGILNDVGSDVGTVNGIFDNFNNIFNSGNIPTGLLAVTNVFNLIYQNGVITNILWFSITIGAFAFILGVLPVLNKGG